jgi:hypothetical protein
MRNLNELLMEACRVFDTARMLTDDAKRNGVDFVTTELDLSMTFAERALASFSAGHPDKAKESALAAKAAYRAVRKFLPKLGVEGRQRELIAVKLRKLTPLIEKLSEIR